MQLRQLTAACSVQYSSCHRCANHIITSSPATYLLEPVLRSSNNHAGAVSIVAPIQAQRRRLRQRNPGLTMTMTAACPPRRAQSTILIRCRSHAARSSRTMFCTLELRRAAVSGQRLLAPRSHLTVFEAASMRQSCRHRRASSSENLPAPYSHSQYLSRVRQLSTAGDLTLPWL